MSHWRIDAIVRYILLRLCTPNFEISDTRDSKIDGRSKKNFSEGFIGNSRDWIFDYGIFNHWYCQLDKSVFDDHRRTYGKKKGEKELDEGEDPVGRRKK